MFEMSIATRPPVPPMMPASRSTPPGSASRIGSPAAPRTVDDTVGAFPPLPLTVSVPSYPLTAVGRNVTCTEQVVPAATRMPLAQVPPVTRNGASTMTSVGSNDAGPAFWTRT